MHGSEWFVPAVCTVLEMVILWLLVSWGGFRSFPMYAVYVLFVLVQALAFAITLSRSDNYFYVFWGSTPLEILLTIVAVLESFWRVFKSFRLLRWFQWILPAMIIAALAYSAWQGYRFPPIETNPAGAAIINAAVTSHYVILAVTALFFLLAALLHVPRRIHEHRFVLGFGVASLAVAFGGSVRAVFGSHFAFVSTQAQPIGYVGALLIWLSAVLHPVPQDRTVSQPVEIAEDLKFQLRNLRSFVRKGTR